MPTCKVAHALFAVFLATEASVPLVLAEERTDQDVKTRVESTPDLPQAQKTLPRDGSQYCAPVAASNGLAYLAKNGYPKLMPQDQLSLVTALASQPFMNTSPTDGTGVSTLILGLTRYVRGRGYAGQVAYQSWRHVEKGTAQVVPGHANVLQIGKGLQGNTLVLLNIGWYQKVGMEYRRLGGHWVTLVGVGKGEEPELIIHDPSGRSPEGRHERVTAKLIEGGTLTGTIKGLPVTAVGAWELGGELKIKTSSGANTAILDGAVLLQLK